MFFAISGFLITTLLLRERTDSDSINLKAFYGRRALRIFPAYYLTLALYVLLALTLYRGSGMGERFMAYLPAFASYTSNWVYTPEPGVTLFVHGWSLSTEEQFYLLWPPLLVLVVGGRRGLPWAGAAAGALVALATLPQRLAPETGLATIGSGVPLPICGGVLLAIALHSQQMFTRLAPFLGPAVSAPLWLAGTLAAFAVHASGEVVAIGLVATVGACVVREDHLLRTLLAWRPLAHLGRISYGVYLYHLFVVLLLALSVGPYLNPIVFAAATLGITACLASLSYTYFETPIQRRGRPCRAPRPGPTATIT